MTNRLFYGDNLDVLREHIASESVDLVYLDPPFNSNANYNILFKSPAGVGADSQIEAFEDTWHWNEKAEAAFHDVMTSGNTDVAELLRAMRGFLKENDMMAYLAMMAVRLIELHRVLKPTGSLYLHCDPTASHYLKLLLDGVFGGGSFQNEIVWSYRRWPTKAKRFQRMHDTILFYSKRDGDQTFHTLLEPPTESSMKRWKGKAQKVTFDETGKRNPTLEESEDSAGVAMNAVWSIPIIAPVAKERLGYPTQKPLALLERIINASSNEGDVVLDPFCGCGTAVDAAQKLGRRWIGIDVTHLSIGLIERRLVDRYGPNALAKAPGKNPPRSGEGDRREAVVEGALSTSDVAGAEPPPSSTFAKATADATSPFRGGLAYEVIGTPNDTDSALKLAADEPHQFQYWITQAIGGQPFQGGRKGMDRGIDGYIYYSSTTGTDTKAGPKQRTDAAIISVKAGQRVGVAMVRDLKGVMEREKADIGIFICVISPTREMEREAASAGLYTDEGTGRTYPRLQIYTLAEYFNGLRPKVPLLDRQAGFKRAAPRGDADKQGSLL
jgi:site-specific DNA-methyltransferase (adenine-specific)